MKQALSATKKTSPDKNKLKHKPFPIVAIGASAGGLEAITDLLKNLVPNTGMAFIYVQHLSPDHKSILTALLAKNTSMKVQEATNKELMQPNNVYVIPPDKEMNILDGHIALTPRPEKPAVNLPIDILFASLAQTHKGNVIGIILSGSASDGTRGMKAIKFEGGLTFAQDDSAKFGSMPRSAIASGAVDFILSPKEIALEIGRLSKHPFVKTNGIKTGKEDLIDNDNSDLKTILNHLYKHTGVDFSAYKMSTIKRRIIRRMLLYKIETLKEYAKMLGTKSNEIDILYQDLLINVTSFFRDTDTHNYLKATLLPRLLKSKKPGDTLRIWVPACATGEEAYSIAMILLEIQESKQTRIPVQIFATDLSAQAIGKARTGIYAKQEIESVSPKRLQRFFTKSDGGYRIGKAVRDICVFAPHNILHDPPFTRLDLVSCCNLFIYLDTAAQKKAVATFHYALNDTGYLMLGKSETIGSSVQLFTGFNKKLKIFSRKKNSGKRTFPALTPRFLRTPAPEETQPGPEAKNLAASKKKPPHADRSLDSAIDAVLVSEFLPASVVINHEMEILQFRGLTDLYLRHSPGKATFNILKMARPEIAFELRNAIAKAVKTKHRVKKSGLEMKTNTALRIINIEAVPLKIEWDEPLLLILFTEQEQAGTEEQSSKGGKNNSLAKDRRIKKLEEELAAAHADALAFAQEQEAYTEELQSANEEVVSSNEELQTVNEELETSKEEIESANEELTTTNQELQTRNDLLNESYDYSEGIIATMHEPMIVLDKDLRVKSANKSFYKKFNVKEEETEGVLLFDLGNRQWNIPRLRLLLEDIIPQNTHFHDFEITHTFAGIGEKTMLLNASRIIQKTHREQLILLAIEDISEQAVIRNKIAESEKQYRELIYSLPIGVYTCNAEGVIELYNEKAVQLWGRLPDPGKDAWCASWKMYNTDGTVLPRDECPMAIAVKEGRSVSREVIVEQADGTRRSVIPYPRTVYDADGKIMGAINAVIDITEQVTVRQQVEASEKRYNMMLMQSPFAFAVLKGKDMVIAFANNSVKEIWGKGNDIEGKALLEILPEIENQPFPALLDKVYTTGIPFQAFSIPAQLMRNGRMDEVYFNLVYQPYHEADETISGVTVIAVDVTSDVIAKKLIEESEKNFRQLAALMPGKITSGDAFGNLDYYNQNWLDYTGLSLEEMQGFGWTKTLHPDELEEIKKHRAYSVETGNDFEMEMRCLNKQGEYKWHLNRAVAVKDNNGKIKRWISLTTEIQTQKEQSAELEKAVEERTMQLEQTNKELALQNEEKEKWAAELMIANKELHAFTYVSSHDLQEPLRKIQMLASRMLEKENEALSDKGKDYLQRMQLTANRMQQLIDDLLAYSHTSTIANKFENADLNKIIDEVKAELKEAIEEKHATIEATGLCRADIMPFQFRQLMYNLIGNALKFSKPEHPPHIIIKSNIVKGIQSGNPKLSPEKNYCHITITDNGIGFEPEFNDKIFEVFQRLHNKEEYGGTGIGLAIVKKIVENHSGIITATGKLKKGATFDIFIPAP